MAAVTVKAVHHGVGRSRISARIFEMQQSVASNNWKTSTN